jgi:hypothetical protein
MTTLHVEPRNDTWIVRRDDTAGTLSEHHDAGEATRAARSHAETAGHAHVFLRDRYNRIRPIAVKRFSR